MKKVTALVLALAMSLTLTACGSPSGGGGGSSSGGGSASGSQSNELEGYPSGTVTWIAPVAAGAAVDSPTRACADLLTFGTVVV